MDTNKGTKNQKTGQKKQNWLGILLGYARDYRNRFAGSVILSIISIVAGLFPFFCMYRIICGFVDETVTAGMIWLWCGLALATYVIKVLPVWRIRRPITYWRICVCG